MEMNTGLRNRLADNHSGAFDGGKLEIRTGTSPGAGNAATGTLLAQITLPSPCTTDAVAGVAAKTSSWQVAAVASGIAGYARFKTNDGTLVMDVTVGVSGQELVIDDVDIVQGGTVTVNSFTFTQPAS